MTLPLLLAVACGAEDPKGGATQGADCFIGDPLMPAEIEIICRDAQGEMKPVTEMAKVPLIQPEQGGKVMFIGVRARNMNGCPLRISTALIDHRANQVLAIERRPVLMEATGDGWMQPKQPIEMSNYSNLSACPVAGLDRSINDEPYQLRVVVEDAQNRRVEKTVTITPTCGEAGRLQQCQCECAQSYRLGQACSSEAATPAP